MAHPARPGTSPVGAPAENVWLMPKSHFEMPDSNWIGAARLG
jgi:hypothetical protein